MKLGFIKNVADEFHRLWSIRVSIWVAVFTATWTIISSSNGVLGAETILWINVGVNGVMLPFLRVLDQGGTNEQK